MVGAGSGRDPFPDEGPRTRDTYREVGERTRQSIERAIAGGANPGEFAVLMGVIYWTTTFSLASDRKTLGKIAAAAGLWDGELDECPRWLTKRVAERLRRLEELDAVTFEPGRGGRSSVVALPPLDEGSFLWRKAEDGNTIDHRRGAATAPLDDAPDDAPKGSSRCYEEGSRNGTSRGAAAATKRGAVSAPPREDFSRTKYSRKVREVGAGHDVGSPAAGPPAAAATADDEEEEHDTAAGLLWDLFVDCDSDVGRELLEIGDHLDRHVPMVLDAELQRRLREDPPREPRLVLRVARALMEEAGVDFPRLDLPTRAGTR